MRVPAFANAFTDASVCAGDQNRFTAQFRRHIWMAGTA